MRALKLLREFHSIAVVEDLCSCADNFRFKRHWVPLPWICDLDTVLLAQGPDALCGNDVVGARVFLHPALACCGAVEEFSHVVVLSGLVVLFCVCCEAVRKKLGDIINVFADIFRNEGAMVVNKGCKVGDTDHGMGVASEHATFCGLVRVAVNKQRAFERPVFFTCSFIVTVLSVDDKDGR